MNITININDYNEDNVYFNTPIKNTVIDNSNFIRTIYSNELISLNGIYLKIKFYFSHIERYFNKYKCNYDIEKNIILLKQIEMIEESILNRTNINDKNPVYKIKDQLKLGNIKLFTDNSERLNNGNFILKISGIWENMNEYGITYKFIDTI